MAWRQTFIGSTIDAHVDRREEVAIPIMKATELRRFAKMALRNVPGSIHAFENVFGRRKPVNDYETVRLPDVGVPTFLWVGR